jgi:23S rRNA (pseudouridine1915-N3)-methyltransferase
MKIKLYVVGKTTEQYLKQGIKEYEQRIKRFLKFEIVYLPEVKANKKISIEQIKAKEQEIILKALDCDKVILLDEHGKQLDSVEFANLIGDFLNRGVRCLGFVIGGPYGFSENLRRMFPLLALSKMTFSHQLVRLIFVEQLYRALTILNSQPYHH